MSLVEIGLLIYLGVLGAVAIRSRRKTAELIKK